MKTDKVKIYKLLKLPLTPVKNAIYLVLNSAQDAVTPFVTDINGVPMPLETSGNAGVQIVYNEDDTINVEGAPKYPKISLSESIKTLINGAVQNGEGVSRLVNDANYITLTDIPSAEETVPIFSDNISDI